MSKNQVVSVGYYAELFFQTEKQVQWSTYYYYVLVTETPRHRWSEEVLQLFRDLSRRTDGGGGGRSEGGRSLASSTSEAAAKPAGGLSETLEKLGVTVLPWARRTTSGLRLTRLQEFLSGQITKAKLLKLKDYVEVVAGWQPAVLPLQITQSSRALLVILHHGDDRASIAYIDNYMQPGSAEQKQRARSLLDTTQWTPYVSEYCRGVFSQHEAILHNCEVLYTNLLASTIPSPLLGWVHICMLLEAKFVVSSGSVFTRGAVSNLLNDLVHPYQWLHTWIPVLPSTVKAVDMMESPVPYIIGVNRLSTLPEGPPQHSFSPATNRVGNQTTNQAGQAPPGQASASHTSAGPTMALGGQSFVSQPKAKCPFLKCTACETHIRKGEQSRKVSNRCAYHLIQRLLVNSVASLGEYSLENYDETDACESPAAVTPLNFRDEDDPIATPAFTPNTNRSTFSTTASHATTQGYYNCPGTVAVNIDNMISSPRSPVDNDLYVKARCDQPLVVHFH
ncbi:DENN (AEX-3) domain protein [Gregarina niphandrodes]|uniref:DENN (AEX-3) domain protein n=1 Tax=Gregarina niphandrodes TaxID=110365 RepID=A0A023AZW1_GRENI|nr:DENN (AEX-3) domain protein [Gregarina niphandrodes]EZG43840.1 DENN (AEX-3) domain protein [Gregarina niphandrodes]|eukprot:XP_011132961.1 DENN (AEX-3) domain protein [Gregarina niphandrodes]